MTSVQERLQLKREPLDKWSLREKLCLVSAVTRSGDQNWMSVSRALKPFGESNRPLDWFHQKNCAAQYGALLGDVETPKRKKRSGMESVVETPAEAILKALISERQAELKTLLAEEKAEYKKIQDDLKLLQTGKVSEEQLDRWCKEIDDEETKREQEALNHAKWLKLRDLKKQEIERAWRPAKAPTPFVCQKRKLSDTVDEFIDNERELNTNSHAREYTPQYQQYLNSQSPQKSTQYVHQVAPPHDQHHQSQQQVPVPPQELAKPALSPLLTSLLKSPSQVHNLPPVPTSILHNTITSQHKLLESVNNSSPTITSLLNAATATPVQSSLHTFTASNVTEDISNLPNDDDNQALDADLLDDPNIKIDDLAQSILEQDDSPFPEIEKQEVDDLISEIIENAHDIVTDPEQHLQLDGNGDININLELDELEQEADIAEETIKKDNNEENKTDVKSPLPVQVIDPFEFQEDPVLFESPVKPSSLKQDSIQYTPIYQTSSIQSEDSVKKNIDCNELNVSNTTEETTDTDKEQSGKNVHGSVEIVEVVTDERENKKEFNQAQIRDIVHSNKEKESKREEEAQIQPQTNNDDTNSCEIDILPSQPPDKDEIKNTFECFEEKGNSSEANVAPITNPRESISDYADDLYDNINMEVKIDKSGKAKRDYSRTKKREEKSFDMLLAIEKAQLDDTNISDDLSDYKVENQKKEAHARIKSESEGRSTSPWTEEEDGNVKATKRRYSTPGTPIDSLPNSPASSIVYYDDDKDHRNWKKSVMLVYNRLSSNKYASLFLKPITDEQAPGYSTVIFRPMDLQTIKKNIDSGVIRNSLEFKRDVMLMFTNALMYNKTNDTVYNMALQMQQESMNSIEILLQAEGQVAAPVRRETRTSESSCKRKRISEDTLKTKKKKDD